MSAPGRTPLDEAISKGMPNTFSVVSYTKPGRVPKDLVERQTERCRKYRGSLTHVASRRCWPKLTLAAKKLARARRL